MSQSPFDPDRESEGAPDSAGDGRYELGGGESLVFVYGTLLRGEPNHEFIARARYLGEALSEPSFDLIDLGSYPAMVEGGETAVHGELYAVSGGMRALIDELEDHPAFFRRTTLALADGTLAECYLLPRAQASCFPRIAGGRWRVRKVV